MARGLQSKSRSCKALRVALLAGLLMATYHFSKSAFSVKGAWDGTLTDVKTFPKGLGPESVSGLAFGQQTESGSVNVAVEDGHLVVRYTEGPLSLRTDDEHAWQANFSSEGTAIRASGRALEDLQWEVSKQADVKNLGNVDVTVNSGNRYSVSVAPTLPDFQGAQLKALARAQDGDLQGRLEAHRQLADNMDLSYSVENDAGDYELDHLVHDARLNAQFDGESPSSVALNLHGNMHDQRYNATFARDMSKLLKSDANTVFGVDSDGIYGSFEGSRAVGNGLTVGYKSSGRRSFGSEGDNVDMMNAARLSHELGTVTLSQSSDGPISALLESDVTRGPLRAQARVQQNLGETVAPVYNLTLSRDMADVMPGAEVQFGIDDSSLDGLYGRVAARRELGKLANLEYSSAGRVNSMEHSVKVDNDLGFARLVKRPDSSPRLQLGYQINA